MQRASISGAGRPPPGERKAVSEPVAIGLDASNGRERHMLRNDERVRVRDLLEQLPARLSCQYGIGAEARAPIRLPALQRMMQHVRDEHDLVFAAAGDTDAEH